MNEKELQKLVHRYLSDAAKVLQTASNKRLQVLSPGRINHKEGPDFLDIAILLDGLVIVGDGEFHRRASDWTAHQHSDGTYRYDKVVLHIVFDNNANLSDLGFETLVLSEKEIKDISYKESLNSKDIVKSAEDLQHFALVRLLRKSSEAQRLLNVYDLQESLNRYAIEFINNYANKRRRPIYDDEKFDSIIKSLKGSTISSFLQALQNNEEMEIPDKMMEIIKAKIDTEGAAFRRELILNVVLPLALCLADDTSRINLFLWFWSIPALNKYGMLSRHFPMLSQNFLWQQQGMLEYLKLHGRKENIVADVITDYGFNEVLSFYRLGKPPFTEFDEIE